MQKRSHVVVALFVLAGVCAGAGAQANVLYPGFHDNFTVTVGSGVQSQISYLGQTGTVYNDPDPGMLYCNNGLCHFDITDNNTWDSSGQVSYLIGAQDRQGPYCVVTLSDGALVPEAELSPECANGATTTSLLHNGPNYQFQVNLSH